MGGKYKSLAWRTNNSTVPHSERYQRVTDFQTENCGGGEQVFFVVKRKEEISRTIVELYWPGGCF